MGYSLEKLDPYRVTLSDAIRCSDAFIDGFKYDDLFAGIVGLPKIGAEVTIFQRTLNRLGMWTRLLKTDRMALVFKDHDKVIAFSTWECKVPLKYKPNLNRRVTHFLTEKFAGCLSKIVGITFSLLGLAARFEREEVQQYIQTINTKLPPPEDCDASLDLMVVRLAYQRKGLGGKLLQAGIDELTECCALDGRKPPRLELHASPMGEGMYAKYGFKTIGLGDAGLRMGNIDLVPSIAMIRERHP